MSNKRVGNVPFSWENRPGIRKDTVNEDGRAHGVSEEAVAKVLPPPPRLLTKDRRPSTSGFHDLQNIPLPPCAFQAPIRSSSKRGDPFLMAYKEITRSNGVPRSGNKNMSLFSCKSSCSVRDDCIVRISQLPTSNSQERNGFTHEV